MYICICHGVTDREIRAAVARGSHSLEDVTMALGVGTCCGQCRAAAAEIISACGRPGVMRQAAAPGERGTVVCASA
jgi:bacterioferritin-associated ferredoxin